MICQFCGEKMEFKKAEQVGLTWTRPSIKCKCGFAIMVQADVVKKDDETIFQADERCKNEAEAYLKEKYERGERITELSGPVTQICEGQGRVYPTG